MRFLFALVLFGTSALWVAGALFSDWVVRMITPYLNGADPELIARYGLAVLFAVAGLAVAWPARPGFLRSKILKGFLERDSGSDSQGIQKFPEISYIQLSLTTADTLKATAWIAQVEYAADRFTPFAIEHNERHAIHWSKNKNTDPSIIEMHAHEPPVRLNVAIYTKDGLFFDPGVGTPTNLVPRLQRIGLHRFTVHVRGERAFDFLSYKHKSSFAETWKLTIHWQGKGAPVVVTLG